MCTACKNHRKKASFNMARLNELALLLMNLHMVHKFRFHSNYPLLAPNIWKYEILNYLLMFSDLKILMVSKGACVL